MRRSIALVAAVLALSLGLLAAAPAEAGPKHGYKHGYGHGHRSYGHRSYGHLGFSDSTLLAAAGIAAGAEVISAYLQRPPAYRPAPAYVPVYAAPTYAVPVRQPICTRVLVPYLHPYGGTYYAPQVQCY